MSRVWIDRKLSDDEKLALLRQDIQRLTRQRPAFERAKPEERWSEQFGWVEPWAVDWPDTRDA